jgi:hypothetical protein
MPRIRSIAALGCTLLAGAGCGGGDGASVASSTAIQQPTRAQLDAAGLARFPYAPNASRIDLDAPAFSNPTAITNPLNPVSEVSSAVVLGEVDGRPLRIEITLLPETRFVVWNGKPVECVVSQFVGYLDGRMKEVALDLFAQGDDGAVWYFGEDVFNYGSDGHIADMEGAWLAGRDGPPGMITPDDPAVGDAYRSENIPGLVFEESTVKVVDLTVDGPRGPVSGAFEIDEHHPEGPEVKRWAPGYGEFYTRDGRDYELMALAVPIDALPGAVPPELIRISAAASRIYSGVLDSPQASSAVARIRTDWSAFRTTVVPELLNGHMTDALASLERAVRTDRPLAVRLAAIDVAVAGLDLQLRHRPPEEIDLERLDLQAAMLAVDAEAGNLPAVRSDVANLGWLRDRIAHTLDAADRSLIDTLIVDATTAAGDRDLTAVGELAGSLRDALDSQVALSDAA